jgi:colanic acid/amylovoran biosynthesis glycosyltransferase
VKRPYLYVLVTDYPYGIGEPFLEAELLETSNHFEHIYLVIPEFHLIDQSRVRYSLPSNTFLVPLQVKVKINHKLKAIFQWFKQSTRKEIAYINTSYKLKFGLSHFKTTTGFMASGIAFSELFQHVLKQHDHQPNKTSIYSYWFTYATWGLTRIKKANPFYNIGTRIHGWDCFFYRNAANYLPLRPETISIMDWICPISETGKKHLIEKIPDVELEKIKVQYLGVDIRASEFTPRYKKGILRIVSVSFIHHVKRIHLIINSLAKIDFIQIEWTHIGSWSSQTAWLQEAAKEKLENKENIHYTFTGEKTIEEVRSFFEQHQADFLICTSESEGIPVSMMEALASGTPVISTSVGGVPEIVLNQQTGFLLPADPSEDEIADALKKIVLMNELEYCRLSENAKKTYLNKFQAKVNYKKFAEEILQA